MKILHIRETDSDPMVAFVDQAYDALPLSKNLELILWMFIEAVK
jgi:hypothetical protein